MAFVCKDIQEATAINQVPYILYYTYVNLCIYVSLHKRKYIYILYHVISTLSIPSGIIYI